MEKIKNFFYCCIIGICFMLLTPLQSLTNYKSIILHGSLENINHLLYQLGYFMVIVFGVSILVVTIHDLIKK